MFFPYGKIFVWCDYDTKVYSLREKEFDGINDYRGFFPTGKYFIKESSNNHCDNRVAIEPL
jgi:hypothetical protein